MSNLDINMPAPETAEPGADENKSPFFVGLEVAIVCRQQWWFGVSAESATIAKIYKNGNFLLGFDKTQWKPSSGWGGEVYAFPVGSGFRSHRRVELWTNSLREEIAETARRHEFSTLVDTIQKYRGPVSESVLIAASALSALIAEPSK